MTTISKIFFKGRKILVTGHTGFIGSWLTKWLTILDAEICGYSLDPPTQPNLYETLNLSHLIQDVRGDIRNQELLRKTMLDFQPEIVFHLAAQPIVLESYDNPLETFDTNVTGTVNLLNELRKVDSVKVIVVVTSDKAYRNKEWVYPYRENDELGGRDPYSASKSCQDIVVNSFRESYFSHSGVAISSARAGNIIGGGDWAKFRLVPDLIGGIVSGETVKIRNPDSVRPWQYVLEPISGMLLLAEKMFGDIGFSDGWNFGPNDQKEITVKELVDKFVKLWGTGNYEIQNSPIQKEANFLSLDISKARRKLGWFPKYDFDSALSETVNWYKSYYNNSRDIDMLSEGQIKLYFGGNLSGN
jgi:CDP-glucose 4,6-dehydratase